MKCRPWIVHFCPKYIEVLTCAFKSQFLGNSELEMELVDAVIRRYKQVDDELYAHEGPARWRHFVESDFMVRICCIVFHRFPVGSYSLFPSSPSHLNTMSLNSMPYSDFLFITNSDLSIFILLTGFFVSWVVRYIRSGSTLTLLRTPYLLWCYCLPNCKLNVLFFLNTLLML